MFIIITPHCLPHLGGTETFTARLSRVFVEKKQPTLIVTSHYTQHQRVRRINKYLTILALPSWSPIFGDRFPIPVSLTAMTAIKRLVQSQTENKQQPIDLIINLRFSPFSLFALMIPLFIPIRRKFLVELGSQHLQSDHRWLDGFIAIYEHIVTAIIKLSRPQFLGVSPAAVKWLQHFHINDAQLLVNGSILPPNSNPPPVVFRSCSLLYASRLLASKGVINLIYAFLRVSPPGWTLRIAGDGPLRSKVQALAHQHSCIHYLGALSTQQVGRQLRHTGALVIPTIYPEGLPSVLIEAGENATPVIATLAGGMGDVLCRTNAIILADNSVSTIATAIRQVARQPQRLQKLGLALRSTVIQHYNLRADIERIFFHDTH